MLTCMQKYVNKVGDLSSKPPESIFGYHNCIERIPIDPIRPIVPLHSVILSVV